MIINYCVNRYKYYGGGNIPIAFGGVVNIVIMLIGIAITQSIYDKVYLYMSLWKIYFNGVISIILILSAFAIIAGIIWLVQYFSDRKNIPNLSNEEYIKQWDERQKLKVEKELRKQKTLWYLTKKMFMAWKEKHCPIIEWKNDK
jgi:hypothetical protein